jgi:hypothetical protein
MNFKILVLGLLSCSVVICDESPIFSNEKVENRKLISFDFGRVQGARCDGERRKSFQRTYDINYLMKDKNASKKYEIVSADPFDVTGRVYLKISDDKKHLYEETTCSGEQVAMYSAHITVIEVAN